MYGVDAMSPDERHKFFEWYKQQTGFFVMQDEIHRYCVSDVTILREACTKFRDMMFDITRDEHYTGLDVFSCTTIASVCMNLFREKFLEQKYDVKAVKPGEQEVNGEKIIYNRSVVEKGGCIVTTSGESMDAFKITSKKKITSPLAKIPLAGYSQQHGYSKQAIQWLDWEALQRKIHIVHACNAREEKVNKYKADGFHEDHTGKTTVFTEVRSMRMHQRTIHKGSVSLQYAALCIPCKTRCAFYLAPTLLIVTKRTLRRQRAIRVTAEKCSSLKDLCIVTTWEFIYPISTLKY